jgi:hypothetical protein
MLRPQKKNLLYMPLSFRVSADASKMLFNTWREGAIPGERIVLET